MNKESGKIQMAKLARLRHREAELHAELAETLAQEAQIFDELAEGESVDLRTSRRRPTFREPVLRGDLTPEDRQIARQSIRDNDVRRRSANGQ